MGVIRTKDLRRGAIAPVTLVSLAVLLLLLSAGSASAAGHVAGSKAAKPGRPTATAPSGVVTTTTPAFSWTKARRAASYEVRVYRGAELLVSRAGIRGLTWTPALSLPTNVDLTWKVRGRAGSKNGPWSAGRAFSVVPLSTAKAITSFSFQGLAPPVAGTIDEVAHTIALRVPNGTVLTALVATFTTTGTSVSVGGTPQVSGVTANNFTGPVTYMVTAADGSSQAYVVTVTVAPSSAKAITAFSFQGLAPPVVATINEAAHTITATVPYGTNVTALVATFSTTGASVTVSGIPQLSGITANNFTGPVIYTVAAADASTQVYVATVTVAAPVVHVGDSFQGGKVAYIVQPGDAGYVAGEVHGLIAATFDYALGTKYEWSNIHATLVGTSAAIGAGRSNTQAIVAQPGCSGGAAYNCAHLSTNGYADWYLPSLNELNLVWQNRAAIGAGGFLADVYWTSTEFAADKAQVIVWSDGRIGWNYKSSPTAVRPVRSF